MIRRLALVAAAAAGLGLAACAEVAPPPGGPIDRTPPEVVRVEPGSLATRVDPSVPLRIAFSEKIDRQSARRGLELIPDVPLDRPSFDDLEVTWLPVNGWPADTVVVWTLTKDLTDRRRVALEEAIQGAFTTADSFPPGEIRGTAQLPEPAGPDTTAAPAGRGSGAGPAKGRETDWTTLRADLEIPAPEDQRRARLWRTARGDVNGSFTLRWLEVPSGPFDLRVYLDGNANGRRDEREPVATVDSLVLGEAQRVLTVPPDDLVLIDLEAPVPVRVVFDSVRIDSVAVMVWFEIDGERRPRTASTDTLGVATVEATPGPVVWGAWVDSDGDGLFGGPADSLVLTTEAFSAPDTFEVAPATPETLRVAWPDSVLPLAVLDTLRRNPVPRDLRWEPPVPE